jgi:hypothetical protein
MSAERDRLSEDPAGQSPWRRWGPSGWTGLVANLIISRGRD